MAKAKAVENSDAANELISTAGTQKQAETGEGSTGTPGTSNAPETPAATSEPTPEQKGTAAPYMEPVVGEVSKQPLNAADQLNLDILNQEMSKEAPALITEEQWPSISQGLKAERTENLVKLREFLDKELGSREIPAAAPYTFQGINEPAVEDQQHLTNLAKFGDGYVDAKHEDGRETVFSAMAWKNLPQTKDGWKPVVKTPPEVAALKK